MTMASVRPSSSHNTQTIENRSKTENLKQDTGISNEVWKLKEQNKNLSILWEIVQKHQLYNTPAKRCMLCLKKK